MSKVTSKLQVTIPKAIADRYGISPGDEIEFVPAGTSILVVPSGAARAEEIPVEERLAIFDETTRRLQALQGRVWDGETGTGARRREGRQELAEGSARDRRRPHEAARGWTREELYERGGRKP